MPRGWAAWRREPISGAGPSTQVQCVAHLVLVRFVGQNVTSGTVGVPPTTAAEPAHTRRTAAYRLESRAPALGKTSLAREGGQDVDAAHPGSGVHPLDPCCAVPPHPVGARGCPRSPSPGGVGQATGRPRPHAYRVHLARTGGHRRADHVGLPGLGQPALRGDRGPEPGQRWLALAAHAQPGRPPRDDVGLWRPAHRGEPPARGHETCTGLRRGLRRHGRRTPGPRLGRRVGPLPSRRRRRAGALAAQGRFNTQLPRHAEVGCSRGVSNS